ncbi:MAG: hypothetical protein FJ265_23060, partial [Planctomycetes bacterium]|nr:hypothetical protein [Planctomycetota bacterium]
MTAAVPAVAAPPRPSRESFRTVLGALLNLEWPTRAGALLQPLARGVRPALARTAEQLARGAGLEPAPVRSVGDLERLLAAVAPRLPGTSADAPETTVAVPAVPPSLRALAEPGFGRLAAAARALAAATGARCLLHGSLASDDWTGYRDADLLLLVPDGACADARALRALRCAMLPLLRALHAFDPLQHHGVFTIPAGELAAWPEHWLPG